jgi:hypothetical protein
MKMYTNSISEAKEEEKKEKEELEEELIKIKKEEELKEQIDMKVSTKFQINPFING